MKKYVLITGGAGFIGSHLCDLFLKKGYFVICMDSLITGSIRNINHLMKEKYFRFVKHDVTKKIKLRSPVHYVLHFASPASPVDYLRYPIKTLKVGSLGTHNSLGIAKRKGAKFMLASTSEVYGDPLVHPQKESYYGNVNPIGPRGVYDEAKRFAEAITMAYQRKHKVNTRIARIFNTYGERMRKDDGRAIPNFLSQALRNKPLTVYGDGSQTRSFCYVEDLVKGICKLTERDIRQPVNLGNPEEFTILELAKKIIKMSGSSSRISFKALPKNDPKVRRPVITKAKRMLGWKPSVPLDEGLKRTLTWFKDANSHS